MRDQLGMTERQIEPLAVGSVEYPFGSFADLPDAPTLLLRRDLDPSRFPREIVDECHSISVLCASLSARAVFPEPVTP